MSFFIGFLYPLLGAIQVFSSQFLVLSFREQKWYHLHRKPGRLRYEAEAPCFSLGRVGIRLQREFDVLRSFWRHDGEPLVLADGDIVLFPKLQHLCVELQCLVLVIDHYAGEFDSHFRILREHWAWVLLENCERPLG